MVVVTNNAELAVTAVAMVEECRPYRWEGMCVAVFKHV